MTNRPEQKHWDMLIDLTRRGVVKDDDSLFALSVIQRFDPAQHDNLDAFYRWCRSNSRRPVEHDALPLDDHRDGAESDDADAVDTLLDSQLVRDAVGQAGYAVLYHRHGLGLSVSATAKALGLSRENVRLIEAEALRIASSAVGADSVHGG